MSQEPDFNWVAARNKCSLATEFAILQSEIKRDTELRNEQLGPKHSIGFKFVAPAHEEFLVAREGFDHSVVAFVFKRDHIAVEDQQRNEQFRLTLMLNDDGECRFRINGAGEFERWQVIRRALEVLFFKGV